MNIFYLDKDPRICAENHCDKHCVKMILEYAQLLSTAHRVLDGDENRQLPDDREDILYKATHVNHPSAVWVRQSVANYLWLYKMWTWLSFEYNYRYDKNHKSTALAEYLEVVPVNIPFGEFTEPTLAMPDECKLQGVSHIESYRNYYNKEKAYMAKWDYTAPPMWFGEQYA